MYNHIHLIFSSHRNNLDFIFISKLDFLPLQLIRTISFISVQLVCINCLILFYAYPIVSSNLSTSQRLFFITNHPSFEFNSPSSCRLPPEIALSTNNKSNTNFTVSIALAWCTPARNTHNSMEPSQPIPTHQNLLLIPVDRLQNTLVMSTTLIATPFISRQLKHYFYEKLVTILIPCLEKILLLINFLIPP